MSAIIRTNLGSYTIKELKLIVAYHNSLVGNKDDKVRITGIVNKKPILDRMMVYKKMFKNIPNKKETHFMNNGRMTGTSHSGSSVKIY